VDSYHDAFISQRSLKDDEKMPDKFEVIIFSSLLSELMFYAD